MAVLKIGSNALNICKRTNGFNHLTKTPNDLDYIARFDDAIALMKRFVCEIYYPINNGKTLFGKSEASIFEIEIAWPGSSAEQLLIMMEDKFRGINIINPPLDVLYTLKMSHRYLRNSPHFLKTMTDIHEMRLMGAVIPQELQEWFKKREAETYNYDHPKLNQSKVNFFDTKGLDYVYDHDSLHEAVKLASRPAYMAFKPEISEVYCSKDMFDAAPLQTKLYAVYEESAVLALERSIIPHPGVLTADRAFSKALEKVSTSITSGWFREFAWESFHQVMDLYHSLSRGGRHYVELFELGLKNGTIKSFNSGE